MGKCYSPSTNYLFTPKNEMFKMLHCCYKPHGACFLIKEIKTSLYCPNSKDFRFRRCHRCWTSFKFQLAREPFPPQFEPLLTARALPSSSGSSQGHSATGTQLPFPFPPALAAAELLLLRWPPEEDEDGEVSTAHPSGQRQPSEHLSLPAESEGDLPEMTRR